MTDLRTMRLETLVKDYHAANILANRTSGKESKAHDAHCGDEDPTGRCQCWNDE